jgi:hypothetical protein
MIKTAASSAAAVGVILPPLRTLPLLSDIEAFLVEHQMTPSTFGRCAMGDKRFVFDLRAGREARSSTEHRARTQMATYRTYRAFDDPQVGRRRKQR